MPIFTIDTDNNITAFSAKDAKAADSGAESFSSKRDLGKLTADWPMSRLIDTWNHFAGVVPFDDLKPVKKFTDRKAAVERIWNAVQRLLPSVAPPAVPVASNKSRSKGTAPAAKEPAPARDGSKKAEVLKLLGRPKGATLAQIMESTGWQAHTVRGFISIIGSKLGMKVESFRTEDKERNYRIAS